MKMETLTASEQDVERTWLLLDHVNTTLLRTWMIL